MAKQTTKLTGLLGNAAKAATTAPQLLQEVAPAVIEAPATPEKKMGRPRKHEIGNMVRCSFALDSDTHAELKVILFRQKTSIQDLVEAYLKDYVQQHQDKL